VGEGVVSIWRRWRGEGEEKGKGEDYGGEVVGQGEASVG